MKPVTANDMRDINRTCILEYLRQNGKASRSQIAQDLSLSLSSVVRITDELMNEKFICLQGEYEFSGGRRRPLIELDANRNVAVSVTLGGQNAEACICDMLGNILYNETLEHTAKGDECIPLLKGMIDKALLSVSKGKIVRGISIGVPGIVLATNRVMAAPAIGMDGCLLADALAPSYPYPVFVENDVNLAALGELWFGYGKSSTNLVYIHIGTLIGMGIILDRFILRGVHHGAGEIGYMLLNNEELKKDYPHFGALEGKMSGYGLQMLTKKGLEKLGRYHEASVVNAQNLFHIAEKEAWAQEIVREFQEKLAMVVVAISTLIDPEIIVLGGGVMESASKDMDIIRGYVKNKTPNPIRIEHSSLGKSARILGGCVNIFHYSLRYSVYRGLQ